MRGDDEPTTTGPGAPRGPAEPAEAALLRLRACVLRGLDRIEALARDRAAPGGDAALRDRLEALEAERDEALGRLEHDRRQLAEAWERLERERVAALAAGHRVGGPAPVAGPPAEPIPAPRPEAAGPDPVEQAILRQFQALRHDVRRNALGRHPA
ncbi:MAG TPA: hypothetical protein VG406_14655 [Isosphaeraceae bacterium]|nr:hypothetical protein [Isosphaeraceae bacterium]